MHPPGRFNAKKAIKSKTLQDSNTKALLATVGQFYGDFI
jgi:hypothetical protein